MTSLSRSQVLAHRVRAQQLDRPLATACDATVLDLGVQDTGPDGGRWALAVRGVQEPPPLVLVWTLRGAPHLYRRADLPSVARAVQPFSDADAGKRIYDACKPLRAAGLSVLDALDAVADAMREVVRAPTVKGEVSSALTARLGEEHLRDCVPCSARHLHEMPFRLAALRAGLELQPGTSPPVLQPMPGFEAAPQADPRHDVVRGYLHLLGPATTASIAQFLDAPVKDVRARWPEDAVEVDVDGTRAWALEPDLPSLQAGPVATTRLLGPYDLYLQARGRELLVLDAARRKDLWRVLGRPGVLLVDGEVAGTWRPRTSAGRLRLEVQPWRPLDRDAVQEQAERLAEHRGVVLTAVDAAE